MIFYIYFYIYTYIENKAIFRTIKGNFYFKNSHCKSSRFFVILITLIRIIGITKIIKIILFPYLNQHKDSKTIVPFVTRHNLHLYTFITIFKITLKNNIISRISFLKKNISFITYVSVVVTLHKLNKQINIYICIFNVFKIKF